MVNSLLTAIVRADGDALVMHVGERPYVVASSGPVELSSRPLTLEAVAGMLTQLLPTDTRRALQELGAIEHELPQSAAGQGDRFTVVAARGGEDIWIEVRRHRRLRVQPRPAVAPPPAPEQNAPPVPRASVPAATAAAAPEREVRAAVTPSASPEREAPPAAVTPAPPEAESPAVNIPAVTTVAQPAAPPEDAPGRQAEMPSVRASAPPEPEIPAMTASTPTASAAAPEPEVQAVTAPTSQLVAEVPAELTAPAPPAEPEAPAASAPAATEAVRPAVPLPQAPAPKAAVPVVQGGFAPQPEVPVLEEAAPPPEVPVLEEAPALLRETPVAAEVPASLAAALAGPAQYQGLPSLAAAAVPVVSAPSAIIGARRTAAVMPTPVAHAPAVHAPIASERPARGNQGVQAPAPLPAEPVVRPLVASPIVERSMAGEFRFEAPANPAAGSGAAAPGRPAPNVPEPIPAVVLPLARNPVRMDPQNRSLPSPRIAGIDRLLRLAAARGANTLYLMSQARPSVRVDGEIAVLDGEAVLSAHEVESLLLDLAPERSREALEAGEGTEWMSEVTEVGRIRCQSFRDHRGPGGIFRMISARPTSAEQLGLAREIQALCAEPEGLVLIAGPRASGKSTLVSALVDVINRTRNDYVITVESQIKFAHESRGCLVSQREVRGGNEDLAVVVRAALRENPDVLVIEDMRSPEVVRLALEAMEAGHLVIGAVSAHGAATAIGRILDQFPEARRTQMQLALAEGLRGVVSQVLLRKTVGGRVAAREVLLNMPSIANLIAEGRISQLPLAIDSGRKHGMVPLNDALAAFVQNGVVDVKEAYRKAFERQAFLAVLRREGVDTSFVERLA